MLRTSVALCGLLLICLFHPLLARTSPATELPDLRISQYEFDSYNDKWVRVEVANYGKAASRPCRLELTIRKIKGSAVNRTAFETIPAIEPGKAEWVRLNSSGILPAAISLKDTTFRLIADEGRVVAESNEDNNETWHNSN